MATLQVGGSSGNKRALDAEIPLVPFIDLLLCCVMFLLVTAVWNQLASLEASVPASDTAPAVAQTAHAPSLYVHVRHGQLVVASDAGDRVEIADLGGRHDFDTLRERLSTRRAMEPAATALTITAEDGIAYGDLAHAMDCASGAGFSELAVVDGATTLVPR